MTAWVYVQSQATAGQLVLKDEIGLPAYAGMTDAAIAAAISAQTEADDGPVDAAGIRRVAMETRFTRAAGANTRSLWGGLQAMDGRTWSEGTQAADHAKNDVICAASSFLAIFSDLEGGAALVRGNALWNSMDKDLEILSNTTAAGATMNLPATSGSPLMTKAHADWMRGQGDRTRQKWARGVYESDVTAARQMA
jgi:hypothetical protein